MLVYGDSIRCEKIESVKAEILWLLHRSAGEKPGIARHSLLVDALILAGELVRNIADAEFAERGGDDVSPVQDRGAELLLGLAAAVVASWQSGLTDDKAPGDDWQRQLAQIEGPDMIGVKPLEGYAFYALYPEAYVEAALRSGLGAATVVIGIRSIGTSLGAIVAAALGAKAAITVRPTGHPFERTINVLPALRERLLADPAADFAIVDEGPGLSGSSFGGVADWLVANGIAEERLHFFPGHAGDLGPKASDRHRERWGRCPRHVVSVENLLLQPARPEHRLESWIADLVGPITAPMRDISGGEWRRWRAAAQWPPSDRQNEKRKFLVRTERGEFLVKFAGLGAYGEEKLEVAQRLSQAGFIPPVLGSRHGFLVQSWCPGEILDAEDRPALIDRMSDYIAFRASLTAENGGASIAELFEMAVFNCREALGEQVANEVVELLGDSQRFAASLRPVKTDNRMHEWEWLRTDGQLLKADALDHHAAHDLVGCQDIAWDIAGAAVEFDLSWPERQRLIDRVRSSAELADVMEACYIGFQLGLWSFARLTSPEEGERIDRLTQAYEQRLDALLMNTRKSDRVRERLG
jgi:hypothetical protein